MGDKSWLGATPQAELIQSTANTFSNRFRQKVMGSATSIQLPACCTLCADQWLHSMQHVLQTVSALLQTVCTRGTLTSTQSTSIPPKRYKAPLLRLKPIKMTRSVCRTRLSFSSSPVPSHAYTLACPRPVGTHLLDFSSGSRKMSMYQPAGKGSQ